MNLDKQPTVIIKKKVYYDLFALLYPWSHVVDNMNLMRKLTSFIPEEEQYYAVISKNGSVKAVRATSTNQGAGPLIVEQTWIDKTWFHNKPNDPPVTCQLKRLYSVLTRFDKVSGIYILKLGTVATLSNTFQMHDTHEDNMIVCRYGWANDLKTHFANLKRQLRDLGINDISMMNCVSVDLDIVYNIGRKMERYLCALGIKILTDNHVDLIALTEKQFECANRTYLDVYGCGKYGHRNRFE